MSKDPAFLFYPNDYLGGTMGMTFEQKGAYIELLMTQFNRGHMTSHMIGQVLGQTGGQIWDTLKDKFQIDEEGRYFNKRLEDEQIKRKDFTISRRNNLEGKNQYPKKELHKEGHMSDHMENRNENETIIETKYTYSKFYDSEIENSKGKPHEANYLKAVHKIYGKIGIYGKCDKILKMKNQLTYDQFVSLVEKSFKLKLVLGELFEKFDNYEGKYKPTSVFRSLSTWLDYEAQRTKK